METTSGNASSAAQIDLAELIERQTFGHFAWMLLALTSITMFLEGFELQLVGYAAPAMIKTLGVDKATFGSIFGAGNFGYMLGALLLGNLGDRFGRRRLIVAGVFLFSVFTLAAGYADVFKELVVLRFIAGIGLGGAIPNAIALTTEYAPRGRRATRVALLYVAYTIGGAGTGLVAAKLMPEFGWQIVFKVGGWAGGVLGVVLLAMLPESVRFMAQRQPGSPVLRTIAAHLRGGAPLPEGARLILNEDRPQRVEVAALFQDGRAALTLLLWLSYVCGITALQFMTSWLPTLISGAGVALSLAVLTGSLFHVGGTFENVVIGWFVDRKGIIMIAVGFLIAVPIVALMGPASVALPSLMIAVFFAGFFIVGSQNGLNATAGIVYPTWMRSTGTGWTTGVGRGGSIVGPVLGGYLISTNMPISLLFLCVTVPLLVTAVSTALLSRHTTGTASPVVPMSAPQPSATA